MPRFWKQEELQILIDAENKKRVKVQNRKKCSSQANSVGISRAKI